MDRRKFVRLIMGGTVLLLGGACGKKGPPERADGSTNMKGDGKKRKKAKTGQ